MGHTPGPWRLHKWGGEFTGNDTIDVLAAGDLEVCAVRPTYDDHGQLERLRATILADANLIAAAPELLAALQEAVTALNVKEKFPVYDTDSYAIAARCDKAIAKAEGRSE